MPRLLPALPLLLVSLVGCSRSVLLLEPGPDTIPSGGGNHGSTCAAGQWSDVLAATVGPRAAGIAVDRDCNVFVVGGFNGTIDLGDGPRTSAGGVDAFVMKLSPRGDTLWVRQYGDFEDQLAVGVAADKDGAVVIAGHFTGLVDLGGGVLDGDGDAAFLLKLDASGNHVYSKSYGEFLSPVRVSGIATGPDGEAVVKGYFEGTVDFGGGKVVSEGRDDIFVVKVDRGGGYVFHRRFGDADYQSDGGAVVIDDNGDILMTGGFQGTVDFGDMIAESAGDHDIFVAKLDAAGDTLWSRAYGGAGFEQAAPIAVGSDGRVAFAGSFEGTVDFGGGPLTSTQGYHFNLFVAELDTNGNHRWSKAFGDINAEEAISLAYGGEDDLVLAGNFAGGLVLGDQALSTEGGWDIFTVRFIDGDPTGARRFGDKQSQQCVSAALDPLGQVLMTGTFSGSLDLGTGALEATPGDADAFITRMPR